MGEALTKSIRHEKCGRSVERRPWREDGPHGFSKPSNDKDKLPGPPANLHVARNQYCGPGQLHPLVRRYSSGSSRM
jgi:hypothetical protein